MKGWREPEELPILPESRPEWFRAFLVAIVLVLFGYLVLIGWLAS